ncbi:MAG: ATP-binding cassette domain-containing protein, partial [Pseudomonadota bacterium]
MAFEMSLECRDLTVRRAGRDVLAGAGFMLMPGDALMVRGTNGSGKTSLLRALAGLTQSEGEITFRRGVQVLDPG